MDNANEQSLLWQQKANQQLFAELCNAFYERELSRLASDNELDKSLLQKRIASLPYYIKRAAEHISDFNTPLDLDTQNGSWISNQAVKAFSIKAESDKTLSFYQKNGQIALVVPISVEHSGIEQVVLDSIDEIDSSAGQLHCNEHGWFTFGGNTKSTNAVVKKTLLKPNKAVMSAACCGHQWLNQRRTMPRLLSLREMLLATRINWRQLSKPMPIKK